MSVWNIRCHGRLVGNITPVLGEIHNEVAFNTSSAGATEISFWSTSLIWTDWQRSSRM